MLLTGISSSILLEISADIADNRNLTRQQALVFNVLSDELVATHKLITGLHLGLHLLKQSLAYTNKYAAKKMKRSAVANQNSQNYLLKLIQKNRENNASKQDFFLKSSHRPISALFYRSRYRNGGLQNSAGLSAKLLV